MLLAAFARDPADTPETTRQKKAIFVVAGSCCLAGFVWSAMYAYVFGWCLTTALPLAFVGIVGAALVVSHRRRNHWPAVYAQIICILYITSFIQWSIGGVFDSGFVMAWAFCSPISALAFLPARRSVLWLALYVVNVAITVGFDEVFRAHGHVVDAGTRQVFFVMNLCVSSLVVFIFAQYFVLTAETARERAVALEEDLAQARKLGPYTLDRLLGAGGMGQVYRARHALLRRTTAIKLLPADAVTEEVLQRFEREVQRTAELSHPNVVAVYDFGRSPRGEFYYAMEHLPGVDLEALVQRAGPLPAARAIPILRQVAAALDCAHERGLIHRDIKPGNIIVSRFGKRTDVVKVVDFGLVKEVGGDVGLTVAGAVCGTPAYLAPEALTAPETVGPAADLYGLGGVAWFLLVGRSVFAGGTVPAVLAHHIHTPPSAPSAASALPIPAALDAWVLRCLAKDPAARFPSAEAAGAALDAVVVDGTWTPEEALRWWTQVESGPRPDAAPDISGLDVTLDAAART